VLAARTARITHQGFPLQHIHDCQSFGLVPANVVLYLLINMTLILEFHFSQHHSLGSSFSAKLNTQLLRSGNQGGHYSKISLLMLSVNS
jgi:hypothetical protein